MRKSECEFFKFTRVTKKTFNYLKHLMEELPRFSTAPQSHGGHPPTSAATALSVTLFYLGNLTSQREIAERFHISQGHLSVLVTDVVTFLCSHADNVIRWPSLAQINDVEIAFKEMANFPGVLGAIDGCHVQILAPEHCQNDYLDRNHTHSVNLMAVCDASKKFTYCFAGFPGSVHDQRVLANSKLGTMIENSSTHFFPSSHYHIVGDSAFQLHHNLMVPYKDTGSLTVKELNFNRKLSQTRRVIENAFGFLKGRFRRLKHMECKLSRVPNNIIACCVLHNLTVCDKMELDLLLNDSDCQRGSDGDTVTSRSTADLPTGKVKRNCIAEMLLN